MKISIIVPVYNEELTLNKVLKQLDELDLGIEKEIIVIDDGSTDSTPEILSSKDLSNIITITVRKNKGKGHSVRLGIQKASGNIITIQDADLEYNPKDLKRLLEPIIDGKADVVYGSRFQGGYPHRMLYFWHSIGNRFLTFITNIVTNLNLSDMETCYKMFKSEVIKGIDLYEDRFGIEPEITCKISRIPNIRVFEVGISYYGRTFEDGKKIGWRDGLHAIFCIVKYGLFRIN